MKSAFLFPGQGAQTVGMGRDFYAHFPESKEVFEQADSILERSLSTIIFEGPQQALTQTHNSQPAIFVTSFAILKALEKRFPALVPSIVAGLSLGEYTALCAAQFLDFESTLRLVQWRADAMNAACEQTKGAMVALLGLSCTQVEELVEQANMPDDLWLANYNCPGQYVLSGTEKGIEQASLMAKDLGAKRVIPLDVHGAFHSGLMRQAEIQLSPKIEQAPFKMGNAELVMNVTGQVVESLEDLRHNLAEQVTASVRWEQSIQNISGVDLFIEVGCGKTLAGMNRKIGMGVPTISIVNVEDLEKLEQYL